MRNHILFLLLHVNLLLTLVQSACQLVTDNVADVTEDGIVIKWKTSPSDETIDILLSSSNLNGANAWFAFGLSEAGGMVGADIFSVQFSDSSVTSISDRYVPWAATPLDVAPLPYPVTDTVQDWELLCSENTPGDTSALVRRKWNTQDEQDRPFVAGSMSAIYAWGVGSMGYHGSNRGSMSANFLGSGSSAAAFTPPSDSDASFVKGFSPGYDLKAITTQYVCQVHDLGSNIRHAVAMEQVYTGTPYGPYVHHVLVHACGNDLSALHDMDLYEGAALPCQKTDPSAHGNSPSGTGACTSILYGGAVGGDPFVLPAEAGLLLGQDTRYVVVEAHLDNPNHDTLAGGAPLVEDIVRFHTASTLRSANAGSMVVGDPAVRLDMIPGGVTNEHFETTCPSRCTETYAGDRKVFSSFLHMHQVGRAIWTSLLKFDPADGTTLLSKHVFDYREYWNFGFQQLTLVDITLSPGDQINTHCTYDTTKTGDVEFGSSSSEEMCMSFLFYYPYQPTDGYYCGYVSPTSSLCGQYGTDNFAVYGGANPVPDGDTAVPDQLFVSYEDEVGDDGEDQSDNAGSEWIVVLIFGVALLVGVALAVGFFVKRRRSQGDGLFSVLARDSNTGVEPDKDKSGLLESDEVTSDQIELPLADEGGGQDSTESAF